MYNLKEIQTEVRKYLTARHPILQPGDITVVRETPGNDRHFYIEIQCPALMSNTACALEFCRYTLDTPREGYEAWQGCGGDFITVTSGRPLLIGDGDDGMAMEVYSTQRVTIWLRDLG